MKDSLYIFVDLDGVFQEPQTYKRYNNALINFNKMVKLLNAKIIISSDWRLLKNIDYFNEMFCNQVVGLNTELRTNYGDERYKECLMYIAKHQIKNFIIIDDKKELFPSKDKIFITNPAQGFNDKTKSDIFTYLNRY